MATPSDNAGAVGTLAAHLRGRVAAYEVWNEPDESGFWLDGPQPAAYAELLKAGHAAIDNPGGARPPLSRTACGCGGDGDRRTPARGALATATEAA